jgi:hypothetical protein
MQYLDLTAHLARERRERYRADAGRNRLARPSRGADGRVPRSGRTSPERG